MSHDDENALRHSKALESGLAVGSKISISGGVFPELTRFSVNLSKDPGMKEIALHVSVRFNECQVVRNTKTLCGWGSEERCGPPFPFTKGQAFAIVILCLKDKFEIEVDGKHFVEYSYRGPLSEIKHLHINGGVSVVNVCLC